MLEPKQARTLFVDQICFSRKKNLCCEKYMSSMTIISTTGMLFQKHYKQMLQGC